MNDENTSKTSVDMQRVDFAFQVISQKLDRQGDAYNSLKTKVEVLLAFIGSLAAVSIPFLKQNSNLLGENFFTVGVLGVYLALIFLFLASLTRTHFDPPDYEVVYSEAAWQKPLFDYMNQILSDMQDSHRRNNAVQEKIAYYYDLALRILWGSITLMFISIFL